MKFKYVAFDMDGTLLDTMMYWRIVIDEYAKERGCRLSDFFNPDDYMKMTVAETVNKLKAEYPDSPVSEITRDDIFRIMGELYAKESLPRKGIIEILEAFKAAGVRMCVITATRRKQVDIALKKAGITDYFEFILTPDDYPKGKGTTDVFLGAAERFGCDVTEIAMFEDALYSIKTAKGLGMYVVGVAEKVAESDKDEIKALCDEYYNEFSEMKI